MAGAGGGGFIFVVTKEPNMVEKVKELIKEKKVTFRLSDKILFFLITRKKIWLHDFTVFSKVYSLVQVKCFGTTSRPLRLSETPSTSRACFIRRGC